MTSLLFTAKVSIFEIRKFGVKSEKLEFQKIKIIEIYLFHLFRDFWTLSDLV